MTSKQLVLDSLEFRNPPAIPRELWTLPWAQINYPNELAQIKSDFPSDIIVAPMLCTSVSPKKQGDKFAVGIRVDEWGCVFHNMQAGIAGEVKTSLIRDEEWKDADEVHIPDENLSLDIAAVNDFCLKHNDKFILSACFPRPFERLQFLRGTERLLMDLIYQSDNMIRFMERMHRHFCNELEMWAKTDVDGLQIMDDWGTQRSLLINPSLWRELFKPMYHDYAQITHSNGKKLFMHSDGHIIKIIPDLIELGVDALNSQLFCMGLENLQQFKGKITFWGEIDRQEILPAVDLDKVKQGVQEVYDNLYCGGGCIAQCEFGPGARPENVRQVFESWNEKGRISSD